MPINAVAIHRLHGVYAMIAMARGSSSAPKASMGAYRPDRSQSQPKTGVANIAARKT